MKIVLVLCSDNDCNSAHCANDNDKILLLPYFLRMEPEANKQPRFGCELSLEIVATCRRQSHLLNNDVDMAPEILTLSH